MRLLWEVYEWLWAWGFHILTWYERRFTDRYRSIPASRYAQAIAPYTVQGRKCELWGKPARIMSKKELLGFVGFLDEMVTLTREGRGPYATTKEGLE